MKYVNLYGKNIDCAVDIPVLLYKISVRANVRNDENIDILQETVLKIVDKNNCLTSDEIFRIIGMGNKYRRLFMNEINEMKDRKLIVEDNQGHIMFPETKYKYNYNYTYETFYVIYDRINNIFLECIIDENVFEKRYLSDYEADSDKFYILKSSTKYYPEKFDIIRKIQDLINKSNDILKMEEKNGEVFEINEFIRPFYEIKLDTVEQVNVPIEAHFLLKVVMDEKQNLNFINFIDESRESNYIDKYIKNTIDYGRLQHIFEKGYGDYFYNFEKCRKNSAAYVSEYYKYDKDMCRKESVEKIAFYREVLSLESDAYKNLSLVIEDLNRLVKSILKEITYKMGISNTERKNVQLLQLTDLNAIKNIFIISIILESREKIIKKEVQVIKSVGETSAADYLKCIYISRYFTNSSYDIDVFNLFSSDLKIVQFINDLWLYRNNSSHNIEKDKRYKAEYDMNIMERTRLFECIDKLMEELIYFIKTIKVII